MIIADVPTERGIVEVKVPLVNNIPSAVINAQGVKEVADGNINMSLAAYWNSTITSTKTTTEKVRHEGNKELYSVTLKADVKIGEHGVAVLAIGNINVTDIYVWKNGQKVQLTTNESNPLGYYYESNGVVFVVLKEDPTVEVDGYVWKTVKPMVTVNFAALNYLYYHWYNTELKQFNALYQKALEVGVNETILQQAKEYNETALENYQKALYIAGGNIFRNLGDFRLFAPLRKAYLTEMSAVELLKKALKE